MPQDLEWWRDSSGSMKSTKSEMKAVGAERVASGLLESRFVVLFALPIGIGVLCLGIKAAILGGGNGNGNWSPWFELIVGLVMSGIGIYYGKDSVALYASKHGLYLRRVKFGFFRERISKIIGGDLITEGDLNGRTLFFREADGKHTKIESGISDKRYAEMKVKMNQKLTEPGGIYDTDEPGQSHYE